MKTLNLKKAIEYGFCAIEFHNESLMFWVIDKKENRIIGFDYYPVEKESIKLSFNESLEITAIFF